MHKPCFKLSTNVGLFFLKWNSNCSTDIFIREAESLNELKKAAGEHLVIPQVFAAKTVDSTPGFLIQEFLISRSSNVYDDERLGRDLQLFINIRMTSLDSLIIIIVVLQFKIMNGVLSGQSFFRDNRLVFLLNLIHILNHYYLFGGAYRQQALQIAKSFL